MFDMYAIQKYFSIEVSERDVLSWIDEKYSPAQESEEFYKSALDEQDPWCVYEPSDEELLRAYA